MELILGINAAVLVMGFFTIAIMLSRTYSRLEKEIVKSRK